MWNGVEIDAVVQISLPGSSWLWKFPHQSQKSIHFCQIQLFKTLVSAPERVLFHSFELLQTPIRPGQNSFAILRSPEIRDGCSCGLGDLGIFGSGWCPSSSSRVQVVQISTTFHVWVYGHHNYIVHGGYKLTNITGGGTTLLGLVGIKRRLGATLTTEANFPHWFPWWFLSTPPMIYLMVPTKEQSTSSARRARHRFFPPLLHGGHALRRHWKATPQGESPNDFHVIGLMFFRENRPEKPCFFTMKNTEVS